MLAEILSYLHAAVPVLLTLSGGIALALIHRKNQQLEKAHVQLAEKVADMANEKVEEDISGIETKVQADEKSRTVLETVCNDPGLTGIPGGTKPGS